MQKDKQLFFVGPNKNGKGPVCFKWDPHSQYLATAGTSQTVFILDRKGVMYHDFCVQGPVLQLKWDHQGEVLAVLQDGLSDVVLCNINQKTEERVETNMKPSFMCWSRVGTKLAIGTSKGNLFIYDKCAINTSNIIRGKHQKKIVCGMWSLENTLALAALDKTMSVSDENGNNILEKITLNFDPMTLTFAEQKVDEQHDTKENTISINMGNKTILLYNLKGDKENPVELAFQPKYGPIAKYQWFGDGYLLVAFTGGTIISISTHMKEIVEELQSIKVHELCLHDLVYSSQCNKIASCGKDGVHVINLAGNTWQEIKSEYKRFSMDEGEPKSLEWTADGQILTVATEFGFVYSYLMSSPILSASHHTQIAYLSSLRRVTISNVANKQTPTQTIEIDIEPDFMAIGPDHLAVGMNTRVWFYTVSSRARTDLIQHTFVGTVKNLCLNKMYCALMANDRCYLKLIVVNHQDDPGDKESAVFPPVGQRDVKVTSIALTPLFLIYATNKGTLYHFYLKDWINVNTHKHSKGITHVYPNMHGTIVLFVDIHNRAYIYSPVDDHKLEVIGFPPSINRVLWDPVIDPGVFIVVNTQVNQHFLTFAYFPQTIDGPKVVGGKGKNIFPSTMSQNQGFRATLVYNGIVFGQKEDASITELVLKSHEHINYKKGGRRSEEIRKCALHQLINLGRLKQAWRSALELGDRNCWLKLAQKALELLDIELAIRVYRELGDCAMVLTLEELRHIEDTHLLAGHITMMRGDMTSYERAQALFMNSSRPMAALQMWKDLLVWDRSLGLAINLDPQQVPYICREYAKQLETKGDYQESLQQYQSGLNETKKITSTMEKRRSSSFL